MNKFLSIFAAAAILVSTAASANSAFNGFGVGVSTGWTINNTKASITQKTGNVTTFDKSKTESKNSFALGVFINYLYSQADSFLWGLEASFDYDFGAKTKFKYTTNGDDRFTVKKTFTTFLTPKFGWNFQDCWSLYGLLGIGGSNFKISSILKDTTTSGNLGSKTNFHFALAPGIGSEIVVADCFKVGLEYKYIHYATLSEKKTTNNYSSKVKTTPCAHAIALRGTYTF